MKEYNRDLIQLKHQCRATVLKIALNRIKNQRTQWVFVRFFNACYPYQPMERFISTWAIRFDADDVLRHLTREGRRSYEVAKAF